MKKIVLLFALAALLASAAAAGASVAGRPTLRLAHFQPLSLRGEHFRAHQRVRVAVSSGEHSWTRRVTTSSSGSFTVGFGTIAVDRCSFVATAFGAGGVLARYKPAEPACIQQTGP
jgi:hypothetical protein